MRRVEIGLRECLAAQPVLVADHDERIARITQTQQRGDHAGAEAQLGIGIDLKIRRFLDQGAVAVDEQDRRHAAASLAGIVGAKAVAANNAAST